jgi:hypothetical protein
MLGLRPHQASRRSAAADLQHSANTMKLYRRVDIEELGLIFDTGMTSYPPRLPEQTIFFPVTDFGYALQIVHKWNNTSGSRAGYVTPFTVDDGHVARFDHKIVGGREHEELWVPAEDLREFNSYISGLIEVEAIKRCWLYQQEIERG